MIPRVWNGTIISCCINVWNVGNNYFLFKVSFTSSRFRHLRLRWIGKITTIFICLSWLYWLFTHFWHHRIWGGQPNGGRRFVDNGVKLDDNGGCGFDDGGGGGGLSPREFGGVVSITISSESSSPKGINLFISATSCSTSNNLSPINWVIFTK